MNVAAPLLPLIALVGLAACLPVILWILEHYSDHQDRRIAKRTVLHRARTAALAERREEQNEHLALIHQISADIDATRLRRTASVIPNEEDRHW